MLIFSLAQVGAIKDFLAKGPRPSPGPGCTSSTLPASPWLTNTFNWPPAAGTLLFICGPLTMLVLGTSPSTALRVYGETLHQLGWAILTVAVRARARRT